MLPRHVAKTASAPKLSYGRLLLLGVGILVLLIGTSVLRGKTNECVLKLKNDAQDTCVALERADTSAARERGLGGRSGMSRDRGMLFVFERADTYCFWMKDMHFAIDIIWLDDGRHVVYMKQNVAPATYPESFCPDRPARFVVELNAGMVRAADLHVGQHVPVH